MIADRPISIELIKKIKNFKEVRYTNGLKEEKTKYIHKIKSKKGVILKISICRIKGIRYMMEVTNISKQEDIPSVTQVAFIMTIGDFFEELNECKEYFKF